MQQQRFDPSSGASQGLPTLVARQPKQVAAILVLSLVGWAFLAWLFIDMDHPFAQLTMPDSATWSVASLLAIWLMWAVMMGAMMLPSALPMILTFTELGTRSGEQARGRSFVAAYLLVWFAFSAAATALQWAFQAMGWINPMIVSTSAALTGLLLVIAGLYQFSPLKKVCLSHCRTPIGFLLGEWRPGAGGAFVMGLRHGLSCVGCCWALMMLLFVGGVMNLAWIAALSVAVAIEKLAARGEWLGAALGLGLIAAGLVKALLQW
jgi:predicted metal-binding membrane protein